MLSERNILGTTRITWNARNYRETRKTWRHWPLGMYIWLILNIIGLVLKIYIEINTIANN